MHNTPHLSPGYYLGLLILVMATACSHAIEQNQPTIEPTITTMPESSPTATATIVPTAEPPATTPEISAVLPYLHLPAAELTAFVHVNVIPMDTEHVLPDQTVVIHQQTIVWMGPAAETPLPTGIHHIEGDGQYLLPGLADMHVHILSEEDFLLYLANGVTLVRNLNGNRWHLEQRQKITDGELLGPTLYTSGPIIDGNPPVFPTTFQVTTIEDAQQAVWDQKALGYDFIKVYSLLSRETYDAILTAAREANMPVVGHLPWNVGLDHALAMGQNSFEHLYGYVDALETAESDLNGQWSYRRIYGAVAIDQNRISEVAAATRDAGVWNCPTLVAIDRWIPPYEGEIYYTDPNLAYVSSALLARWHGFDSYLSSTLTDSTPELRENGRQIRRLLVKGLHDAGAGLLLGTDSGGFPYVIPGFSIHTELQNLVEAGLTPYEAIQTGTRHPAEFLNALDQFGTVAIGKRADLILVTGNPLENITHLQNLAGVMVGGQWLTQAELQQLLEEQKD